ncbi:rhomboid family intramembrane serine protease [Cytophagales bacterium LB-30]|uniref:Rhomboid family intramembrane serine protease n=1 Tax=Shiella aurantiaca TaxID=3058365 RepID=A0ABT8F160_9BACT|nr:rhomboid family intramembrane serine protease [Shiella aurantiaca]MDN4164191.1 rhomboid family intramembrane serine protease [Shiella aurantiaca]
MNFSSLKKTPLTFLLILACLLMASFMAVNGILFEDGKDVIRSLAWGSNFAPYTLDGEYWRLLSNNFVHFGIFHLLINMYSLYYLGKMTETRLGSAYFVLFFLVFGVAGSLSSLYINLFVISAGASSAIFGLYGFVLSAQLVTAYKKKEEIKGVLINFLIFIGINVLIGLSFPVDNAAHIGGFLMGVFTSLFFVFVSRRTTRFKTYYLVTIALLFSVLIGLMPRYQVGYYQAFQELLSADALFKDIVQNAATDSDRLIGLQEEVKPVFDSVSEAFTHLEIPREALQKDTTIIIEYIRLRQQLLQYYILGIEKESYTYHDSIDGVVKELNQAKRPQYVLNFSLEENEAGKDTAQVQKLQAIKMYFDSAWAPLKEPVSVEEIAYYRIGNKDSLGRWQGASLDFYANGGIQMKGHYQGGVADGIFIYYSPDSTYTRAGLMVKGTPVRKWEEFHPNGRLAATTFFEPAPFIDSYWDESGKLLVHNGEGIWREHYPSGQVKLEGPIQNGKRNGVFVGYYADGRQHFMEEYLNGALVYGRSVDEGGKVYNYQASSRFLLPPGGWDTYSQQLAEAVLGLPCADELGMLQEIKAEVLVNERGQPIELTVVEPVNFPCFRELEALILGSERWQVERERGYQPTASTGYLRLKLHE